MSAAAAAGAAAPQPLAPPEIQAADPEALREVLEGRTIETTPWRPQLGDYLEHLVTSGWQAVRDFFQAVFGGLFDFGTGTFTTAITVLQVVIGLLVALGLYALLRQWLARRRAGSGDVALPAAAPKAGPSPAERDWQAELAARLAAGDGRGSLEALWWWLARQLDAGPAAGESPVWPDPVDPSWTTRELLGRRGRSDLRVPGRALDRLLYAEAAPQASAVAALFDDLRRALGRNG